MRARRSDIVFFLLLAVTFMLFHTTEARAEDQRVYDEADLFSDSQEQDLEEKCHSYAQETGADLVILTVDDAQGKSSEAYADDFYDEGGFGFGEEATGAILLIDMDNRMIYISTCGEAIYYMTDARIEEVLNTMDKPMANEAYYKAADIFLEKTRAFLLKDPYARPTLKDRFMASLKRSPIYLVLSAIVAAISAMFIRRSEPYKNTVTFQTYQDEANFNIMQFDDILERENTTMHRIIHEERTGGGGGGGGSSTHISSGGVTHGGGGHHF